MTVQQLLYQAGNRQISFHMDLDPTFPADRWIIDADMHRVPYEADITSILFRTIKEGDTVVDVGANVGYFTCMMAVLVGPTGKVYSFEPGLNNLPNLDKNIELNGFKQVKIVEKPAWSSRTTKQFYHSLDDSGGNALWDPGLWWENKKSQKGKDARLVETTTLDNEVQESVALIKIDTEGAEQSVLEGARYVLDRLPFCNTVIAEISNFALEQMGSSENLLRAMMEKKGYNTFLPYATGDLPKLVPPGTRINFPHNVNVLFSTIEDVATMWPEVRG